MSEILSIIISAASVNPITLCATLILDDIQRSKNDL